MAGRSTDVNLKENIILELNRHIKLLEEKHENLQQTLQLKGEILEETNRTIRLLEEKIEEQNLLITSITNFQNFRSINTTHGEISSVEESAIPLDEWNDNNVRNVRNDSKASTDEWNVSNDGYHSNFSEDVVWDWNARNDVNESSHSIDIISELMRSNGYDNADDYAIVDELITNSDNGSICESNHSPISASTTRKMNETYSNISSASNWSGSSVKKKYETFDTQICHYRYNRHWDFINNRRVNNTNNNEVLTKNSDIVYVSERINRIQEQAPVNNVHTWPKKTVLIASDSMFTNLDEKRLSKNGYNVKVRPFKGSTIADMYYYLYPLLQKQPEYLVLHVGTNDCVDFNSSKVFEDLLMLKGHIEVKVPGIKVILSQPITRFDNDGIACMRVRNLIKQFDTVKVPLLVNSNISRKHVGKRGLHLNDYGTARCAMNIISLIKGLP